MIWDYWPWFFVNVLDSVLINDFLTAKLVVIDKVDSYLRFVFLPHINLKGDSFVREMIKADIPHTVPLSLIWGTYISASSKLLACGLFNHTLYFLQTLGILSGISINSNRESLHLRIISWALLAVVLYLILIKKDQFIGVLQVYDAYQVE